MKNANRIHPKGSKPAPVQQPEIPPIPQPQSEPDRSQDCLSNLEQAVAQALALMESQAATLCQLEAARDGELQQSIGLGIILLADSVSKRLQDAFNDIRAAVGQLRSAQKGGNR